jgi:hypothetical protein
MNTHNNSLGTDVSQEDAASIFRVFSIFLKSAATWFLARRFFYPERRYVPPKRRFTQDLHGATTQKTAFFIHQLAFFL